jgi:hypothetical protein
MLCLQGVQNMIRLLFVRENDLFIFNDTVIYHGRPQEERLLDMLGCPRDPRDGDPIADTILDMKKDHEAPAAVDGTEFDIQNELSRAAAAADAAVTSTYTTAGSTITNSNSLSNLGSKSGTTDYEVNPHFHGSASQEEPLLGADTGRVVEAPLNYEAGDEGKGKEDESVETRQVRPGGDDDPLISFAVQIATPAGDDLDLDQLAVFQYRPCALGVPEDYNEDVFIINGKKCWAPLSGLERYSKSFCKSYSIMDTFCDLLLQKASNEAMKMGIKLATVETHFQSTGGVRTLYQEGEI